LIADSTLRPKIARELGESEIAAHLSTEGKAGFVGVELFVDADRGWVSVRGRKPGGIGGAASA